MNESSTPSASDVASSHDAEPPLAHRVIRGGLWVAASSYFNIGFGFLATLVLTRLLTPEDFGTFALAGFLASLVSLRHKIGVGYALAQRTVTTGELVGTHLVLDITAGVAALLLSGAVIPVLYVFGYSADVIWVMLAFLGVGVLESIMGTPWTLLHKELHFPQTSIISSLMFPLSYIPAFYLALHGGGFWSLMSQTATYALLLVFGMWWIARRRLPHVWRLHWRFDRVSASELLHFGVTVGLAGTAATLVAQFDSFLVGSFVGVAALGFYDRAYRIAQWPSLLVTGVISRAAFYTYARLQGEPARLERAVTMSLWLITSLALPLATAVFAAAPDLVRLLYGDRWLPSAVFLRFLVAYAVLRPLSDDAGSLFVAVGRPKLTLRVALIQLATLASIGTVLTLGFGVMGTCVAVGVTFLVGLVLTYRYVVRVIALRIWDNLGMPVAAAAFTLLGYVVLIRVVDMNAWPLPVAAVVKLVYGAAVYFAVILALQPHQTMERATDVWRLVFTGLRPAISTDTRQS